MDPNAGWFAVAGALAVGLPQLVGVLVEAASKRGQRKADATKAEADRAAAVADRVAADAATLREQHRQKIAAWRDDLRDATLAETQWRINDYGDIMRPNLIGQPWFEELRGYLSESFSFATEVHADGEMVGHLSRMISHLEREWKLLP